MSILIVTPDIIGPIKNGGIGTACFHYARTLANHNLKTSILFTGPVQNRDAAYWRDWYAQKGITFFTLEDLPATTLKTHGFTWHSERSHRILNFLREREYGTVFFQDWQANGFWTTRFKRMGMGLADTTVAVIAHSPNQWQKEGMETFGSDPLGDAALEWEEKQTIAGADVLVSPSHHMVQWMRDKAYKLPSRVEVCPCTFEDSLIAGDSAGVDRDHLIFFGRLETRKGVHLLADALRALKTEGQLPKQVSLLGKYGAIQGRPAQSYIDDLISDLPDIDFHVETEFDYAAAVAFIRRRNGIVVMPSTLDNFPLTIIESIANGFCFISSDVGGIPEMADPLALFEPTVAGLKQKLRELPDLPFATMKHLYEPNAARTTWLDHCARNAASPPAAPHIASSDPDGVSVCVSFYHFDRFMPRLIGNFLESRDPSVQLVFVNDGTPEEKSSEFLRYKRKLEPLGHIFYTQDNAGAGAARNKAVELAAHDKLIFFDSDNIPFAGFVARLRDAMKASGADSVGAPFLAIPAFTRSPTALDVQYAYQPPGGPLANAMFDNRLADTCGIQRRDVFEKLGGFSTNRGYYDDWEYFIRLLGNGYDHIMYPEPLFYYAHDPKGRRAESNEYVKLVKLWSGLQSVDAASLREILEVLVRQIHVMRS